MAGTTIEEAPTTAATALEFGWQRFQTDDLELSLPERCFGGDPRREMKSIREQCNKLGPEFESIRRSLCKRQVREDNVEYGFLAFDPDVPGLEIHALHVKLPLFKRGMTLARYMKVCLGEARQVHAPVLEQSVVQLGPYDEAGRMVMEMVEKKLFHKAGPAFARQLSYAVKGRKAFWLLQYTARIDDWERLLPVFEQSAATLRLKELEVACERA